MNNNPENVTNYIVIIDRIIRDAVRRSGMYYEVYDFYARSELKNTLNTLSGEEAKIFSNLAKVKGFRLLDRDIVESHQAYLKIMKEIKMSQT